MPKFDQIPLSCIFWEIFFEPSVPVSMNPHEDTDAPITTLHYHNCLEVSVCIEGYGILFLGNELRAYSSGDCIVIPKSCPHRSQSAPSTTASWKTLYIQMDMLGKLMPSHGFKFANMSLHQFNLSQSQPMLLSIDTILQECHKRAPHWQSQVAGYLLLLLTFLERNKNVDTRLGGGNYGDRQPFAPALNFIAEHISDPLPIAELAKLCHLSEPHFRRLFKRTLGVSPKQYILQMRIELAKSMLADTRKTVLEIAYNCGFETISAFNRAFKLLTASAPLEWRKVKTG